MRILIAALALLSSIAGAGAQTLPVANGSACAGAPPLSRYQDFANTAAAPTGTTLNVWDGTQCVPWAVLNESTHSLAIAISAAPTYSLASGSLAAPLFVPLNSGTQTVAASNTFDFIRGSNSDGTDIAFTVGAGALATGPYFSLTAASGSSATSNVYGGVFHATNAGPGTVRGAHLGGFGLTGSTGAISAAALQIQPVATNSGAWGGFASLTSSGVNGIATGYGIETNGDTYSLGFGSVVAPVGYTNAAYRAWMATASSAGARAFQTLNNAGSEIQYIKLDGSVVSSVALIGGTEANGTNVTQTGITRNNAAGTLTIAAGTNAGNSISLQTGGATRLAITDSSTQLGSAGNGNGALVLNGNTSGTSTLVGSTTGGHAKFTSSSTPTLTAGCNGAGSAVSGTDQHGTITGQTAAATTCTLTFGTAFGAAPDCVASGQSSPLTGAFTPSAGTLVVNFASTANFKWSYICFGT